MDRPPAVMSLNGILGCRRLDVRVGGGGDLGA